ncbi:MAG: potassium channel family protein [Blastocatellia bacterium]
MKAIIAVLSLFLIFAVLLDAFEAIVLPRRVTRQFRLTRFFYQAAWSPSAALARHISSSSRREAFLGFFGPLSLILLLSIWAVGLIMGFGALHWSLGSPIHLVEGSESFWSYVYLSGTTFFTLGYGDVTPRAPLGRALTIAEAGMGFGFLALIIGYVPVIYQAFSRREASITLLDARAGSPPSAAELLRRHGHRVEELEHLLRDWEHWAADLLESHLSYPVLCYYRSQHKNQSWLTSLTAILDASALVMAGIEGISTGQARLTFAMARHAVVDLGHVFNTPPRDPVHDRLPSEELNRVRQMLAGAGIKFGDGPMVEKRLTDFRRMYEPYITPLADYLLLTLPSWTPAPNAFDNWQTSKWGRVSLGSGGPGSSSRDEEHF